MIRPTFVLLLFVAGAAQEPLDFQPLCNGRDLTGWHQVNCAESTWTVRDGMIVCSGRPTGVLRSDAQYENFVLELEWRHLQPGGNAGLFVWSDPLPACGVPFTRSIEVQILDGQETADYTSHGDVFSIHGATMQPDRPHPSGWQRCLPSERRAQPAGEWNHYRVVCNQGTLKLEVNGKEVSGGHDMSPRKGYICLESEGSEVHFRNLRLAALPAANPPLAPEHVAPLDRGWRSLYHGLDLEGWVTIGGDARSGPHWRANDWILASDGTPQSLWTERDYANFELMFAWRGKSPPTVLVRDGVSATAILTSGNQEPNQWHRMAFTLQGKQLTLQIDGKQRPTQELVTVTHDGRRPIGFQPTHGNPLEIANVFVRELPASR